jgi:sugar O-acyltransferase (sialic acid O-acetyltransferase NeuD family)
MPDPPQSSPVRVQVPQLNANDTEAKVAALFIANGQRVEAGDVVCEIETTKAVEELSVEVQGFIAGLSVVVGDNLTVGATLCWISADPEWEPPVDPEAGRETLDEAVGDLRITGAARDLAADLEINFAELPTDRIITTEIVRQVASGSRDASEGDAALGGGPHAAADSSSILVYGAGGHGKTLIDLLRTLRCYRIVGVIDDDASVEGVSGVPVLGGADRLETLRADGIALAVNAVGTVGAAHARLRVAGALARAGFLVPTLVHPSAVVEPSALLARGAQILARAYIGSDSMVGPDTIVNTGAIVSHDCTLGHHVHLTPGAIIAGGVHVGDRTLIGMGATVFVGVSIGADVLIGNGARIHADVPDSTVVPTGAVWPR